MICILFTSLDFTNLRQFSNNHSYATNSIFISIKISSYCSPNTS